MIDEYRMINRYTIDGFDSPSMIGRVVIEQNEKSQNSSDIPLFHLGQIVNYSFHARLNLSKSEIITVIGKVQRIYQDVFGVDYLIMLQNGNVIKVAQEQLAVHKLIEDGPKYTGPLPFL